MKWLIGVAALLVVALVGVWFLGGARTEVAKDKALKKIDSLLGETEVQRKEVDLAVKNMDKSIDELIRGRIEAQEKAKILKQQAEKKDTEIADADKSLIKLKDLLQTQSKQTIAGTEYTHEQIEAMAEKVIKARKSLTSSKETLNAQREKLESIAKALEEREATAKERLASMKTQLKEIDTELVSLRTLKDATAKMGGDAERTFADNYEEVEKKVTALKEKVTTESRMQEEKWKVLEAKTQGAKKELDSADSIISATKGSGDTLSEIDKVLSGNK